MRFDGRERANPNDEAIRRAAIALSNQRPAEAERLATEALKNNASHPDAIKILGRALMMLNRYNEAIVPLEKLARSSRDPESATLLAIALRNSRKIDEAEIWLKRAIKRKPAFPLAFYEFGGLLKALERFDEAIEILKQGLDLAPMAPEMALQLGSVYYSINDRTNARKFFSRARSISPQNAQAIQALGTVLMDEHDYANAAELFGQAITENPNNPLAQMCLGYCRLGLGQTDAAYDCLRTSIAISPQLYGKVLKMLVTSGRGRFWLRPSHAAKFFERKNS